MTYSELLKRPEWKAKRLIILRRDNFKCQRCDDPPERLDVHHKYYTAGAMPWEYPNDALITLCMWCHEKEEIYRRSIKHLLKDAYELDVHAEIIADLILAVVWNAQIEKEKSTQGGMYG